LAEPINLNKFRKAKKRAEKDQQAVENRVKHGRTKAEKARDRLKASKAKNALDGHKKHD
jgi:hypothetical protein